MALYHWGVQVVGCLSHSHYVVALTESLLLRSPD